MTSDKRKVCLKAEITSACGKLLVAALASRCATRTRIPFRPIPQLTQDTHLWHAQGAQHAPGSPCGTSLLPPAKRREIAHRQCLSLAGPRLYCTYSQVVVDGGNPIYSSRYFWKGLGLWGSEHAVSRGCDLCAIEPCWLRSARVQVCFVLEERRAMLSSSPLVGACRPRQS